MSDTRSSGSGTSAKARAVVDRGIPVDTWEWVDVVNAISDLIAENERLMEGVKSALSINPAFGGVAANEMRNRLAALLKEKVDV